MRLIYRIEELFRKSLIAIRTKGFGYLVKKIKIYLTRNLFGRNFSLILSRGSYSLLWQKVFEAYKTKGLLIFVFRLVVVTLFGWVVFFITPKVIDFVPEKKIISWYRKNKRPVSIVIPVYNDYELTIKCVESIRKFSSEQDVKIILVDDGSDEETIQKLKTIPEEFILSNKNEGFARTVNKGLIETKTEDVVVLNNDTLVQKGWLESLQFWAYSDAKIGIVGPKLLYPDQTIQWAGSYRNLTDPDWFDHYYRFQKANYPAANYSHPVLAVTGACMYVKREVLNKIGVFDPEFGMAFEDIDYCLRAWQAGFKSVYCPKSIVTHLESKTRGKKQGERELKSKDYFWEKWGEFFNKRSVVNKEGKLRIIYVNQDNGVGGGPRVLFEHLNRLQNLGHEVALFSVDNTPDWFDLKVPVKTFKNYQDLTSDLKTIEAIKVATWWETAQAVWESSIEKGIPFFLVQDVESSYYKGDSDYQDKVLSSYRKEFNYITDSDWNREKLSELAVEAKVVNPGISEIFKQTGTKRVKNQLLALGRSLYLKNFDLTEKAWKLMGSKPKLKLFGIEPRIGKLLGADYEYKPTDSQVVKLYNESEVFIQTSIHEGFCLPVLEAMACGCVVVCTEADGNREFCIDGKNCLIVSKTDAKDVANKLEKVFKDEGLKKRLVSEGLKTTENYRWEKKIIELESFYKSIANNFGNKL